MEIKIKIKIEMKMKMEIGPYLVKKDIEVQQVLIIPIGNFL